MSSPTEEDRLAEEWLAEDRRVSAEKLAREAEARVRLEQEDKEAQEQTRKEKEADYKELERLFPDVIASLKLYMRTLSEWENHEFRIEGGSIINHPLLLHQYMSDRYPMYKIKGGYNNSYMFLTVKRGSSAGSDYVPFSSDYVPFGCSAGSDKPPTSPFGCSAGSDKAPSGASRARTLSSQNEK